MTALAAPVSALQFRTPHYRSRSETRFIVIHHAAAIYPRGGALQAIYDYHKNSPVFGNYDGIGYHVVIQQEPNGTLTPYLVNPAEQVAAHVAQHNPYSFGICAATNLTSAISVAWWNALVAQAAYARTLYPNATIVGHTEIRETSCPGSWWTKRKDEFLRAVEAARDPFAVWAQAGFPLNDVQRNWAIPQAWLKQSTQLGPPTTNEIYLNSFQSFQGFRNGTLYFNARSGLVEELA